MKLPPRLSGLCATLGIARAPLTRHRALCDSPHLAHMPEGLRSDYARVLVRDYLLGRPIASVVPGFYPFLAPDHRWDDYPDAVLARGDAPAVTQLEVLRPVQGEVPALRAALHVHAYFLDGLPDILDRLALNRTQPDLFVTGPSGQRAAAEELLARYPGRWTYRAVANVGRDVVPFLELLPDLLAGGYDLIGHVHIKQSITLSRAFARLWSDYMLSGVLGQVSDGKPVVDAVVQDAAARGHEPVIYFPHMTTWTNWNRNRADADQLADQFDLGPLPDQFVYSAGTMFWATPAYLTRFAAIRLDWATLLPEPVGGDGTLLHAIERLFGAVACAGAAKIVITGVPLVPFVYHRHSVERANRTP